jgi:hypothetical protein
MGTGTPKRRLKEGVFDRINEKHVLIPSERTCWENPSPPSQNASICRYSACQKIFGVTPHRHTSPSSLISHLSIKLTSPFSITLELIIPLFVSLTLSRAS